MEAVGYITIKTLPNKILREGLDAVVEPDGDGYIARTVDLPLYGNGDDVIDAVDMLKREIVSLYDDLMEDDNFTDEWLKIKAFLKDLIRD